VDQLRDLLQTIWSDMVRDTAGVTFSPGEVLVSVKGGQVIRGGAPLDLILQKVESIQALFYRTAELLNGVPHRKRGLPSSVIQEMCRPWLFQAAPGSYQFAVAVQGPAQADMFPTATPTTRDITTTFLTILRAAVEDPDTALPQVVPDSEYRGTFLRLARSLAPTGKRFSALEVRAGGERHTITLASNTRATLNQAFRRQFPKAPSERGQEETTLRGILRALHLDQDWLEITVDGSPIRISDAGEAVDDVVGPMVNRPVIVDVVRDARGQFFLRDIQTED
jgi:hypothetical protein